MLISAECLALFALWPHISPTLKDLVRAGFSHKPISKEPDSVIYKIYNDCSYDWEPEDDPETELYIHSKSCLRLWKSESRQKPSPKDIGFLGLSLQYNFPKLYLFHDIHAFCDRIKRLDFQEADILALLPKFVRGEALTWFRKSKYQDLAGCIRAMRAKFQQAAPQATSQSCQAPDYHHCNLYNASFPSMTRLIRHAQENIYHKPSCRHCEKMSSSRNQLHQHLRENCWKQMHRQPSSLSSQSPPASSPPKYQTISPPPPTYKVTKDFIAVEHLYNSYATLYLKVGDFFRMFGQYSASIECSITSTVIDDAFNRQFVSLFLAKPPIRILTDDFRHCKERAWAYVSTGMRIGNSHKLPPYSADAIFSIPLNIPA